MRINILKKNSTKAERVLYEILKELKLNFRHRWIIDGIEVDFLVGKIVIEVDGHPQAGEKNQHLASLGYVPIHFHNDEIINNRNYLKEIINELCIKQKVLTSSQKILT